MISVSSWRDSYGCLGVKYQEPMTWPRRRFVPRFELSGGRVHANQQEMTPIRNAALLASHITPTVDLRSASNSVIDSFAFLPVTPK